MKDYFDNWGSRSNPIIYTDLIQMFEGLSACPKKVAMSKMYPKDTNVMNEKIAKDLIIKSIIRRRFFGKDVSVRQEIKTQGLNIKFKEQSTYEWQDILDLFFQSKEFEHILYYLKSHDRAFIYQSGKNWITGIVDAIIKTEKEITVIIWKTGSTKSQFELDRSYTTKIYSEAMRSGKFFVSPISDDHGRKFRASYDETHIKDSYQGKNFRIVYVFLNEFLPAKRKSKKKALHYSMEKMSDQEGMVHIEKGARKGPVFYETRPIQDSRVEYIAKCGVMFAQSGVFPERFGMHCEHCMYRNRCESISFEVGTKQQALNLMDELGIDPD